MYFLSFVAVGLPLLFWGYIVRPRLRGATVSKTALKREHYVDIVLRVDFQLSAVPSNTAKRGILQGEAE